VSNCAYYTKAAGVQLNAALDVMDLRTGCASSIVCRLQPRPAGNAGHDKQGEVDACSSWFWNDWNMQQLVLE
jgi:uracil-DNA glycosylase